MDTTSAHPTGLGLRDYVAILWRRKWLFAVPALLVLLGALAYALAQTPIYRSEATILIEDAEIPEDLVTTLVGDYIEKRLEAIDRRVMVTDSLLAIIERYNLYPELRRTQPAAVVAETMRENIARTMIRAEVVDPRSGDERAVTVAFQLSFDHPSPEMAQRITNELVSLYLSQNLRRRQELASETTSFFQNEREQVEERIAELEARLAEFKQANAGSLPDQLPYNQQIIARAEQELRDLSREAQSLREREGYLQSQLARTEPHATGANGSYRSPSVLLAQKRTEYAALSGRYSSEHPDLIKLEREIAALEQQGGGGRGTGALEDERAALAGELERLQQRYGTDHPDVRQAERSLAAVEGALRQARQGGANGGPAPDNPIYVQLQADLNSVQAQLEAVRAQRDAVADELSRRQEQMLRTPLVEREYAQLQRALTDAINLRDQLASKETTASLGQTLEAELKAERLALIEPATLPMVPVKPNRPMIALIGLVLALGCGAGLVTVAEAVDEGVYGKDVLEIAGAAPLAVVPRITSPRDRHWRVATAALAVLIAALALGAAVWWVHNRYMPLDLAYYDLQRRVQAVAAGSEAPVTVER